MCRLSTCATVDIYNYPSLVATLAALLHKLTSLIKVEAVMQVLVRESLDS